MSVNTWRMLALSLSRAVSNIIQSRIIMLMIIPDELVNVSLQWVEIFDSIPIPR